MISLTLFLQSISRMCIRRRICRPSSGNGSARMNRSVTSTIWAQVMSGRRNWKKCSACSAKGSKNRRKSTMAERTGSVPAERPPWVAADTIPQGSGPVEKVATNRRCKLPESGTSRISDRIKYWISDSFRWHSENFVSTLRV